METQTVIEVQHIRKTYGTTVAVEDISFEVRRGEIFCIVGPNGTGKTTTVECLVGLRKPDGGQMRILGMDPVREERALRQRIGVQLQQAALPEEIKVWEALDLYAGLYDRPADWRKLLETWGLSEKRNARFNGLSGGQKQRLFIALALVNDPEVVFLDELTTGLDPQARRGTWELVEKLRADGKSVLLVTHFMEEAERLCDRVAIIDHGRLIALDTPEALIRNPKLESRVRFGAKAAEDYGWLRDVPEVLRIARENGHVVVYGRGAVLARVASALADRGIFPPDLRAQQTTLDDVFITLTGKTIREE